MANNRVRLPIVAPPRFKAGESQRHGEMAGGDDNRNRTQNLRRLRQKHAHNQCRAYSIVETRSAKFKSSQGSRKKLTEVFLKPLGRFQKSPGLCRQRVYPFALKGYILLKEGVYPFGQKGYTLLKEGGIPLCVKGVYPFEGRGYTPFAAKSEGFSRQARGFQNGSAKFVKRPLI